MIKRKTKNKDGKALSFLDSTTKQIITLSTGSIVLTATFLDKIVGDSLSYKGYLICSWVSFSLAIVFGLLVLGAIIRNSNNNECDVYKNNTRWLSLFQYFSFLIGLVAFWIFALLNLK